MYKIPTFLGTDKREMHNECQLFSWHDASSTKYLYEEYFTNCTYIRGDIALYFRLHTLATLEAPVTPWGGAPISASNTFCVFREQRDCPHRSETTSSSDCSLTRAVTVSLLTEYAKSVARRTICAPPQGIMGASNVASVHCAAEGAAPAEAGD